MMTAISLGWGVQSFGLAAMSALGVLPKVDVAIHADTTHEREATYRFAAKWTPWLEDHGVKVVTVRPDSRKAFLHLNPSGNQSVMIPAFTVRQVERAIVEYEYDPQTEDDEPVVKGTYVDANYGQLERQCTRDWKIAPIRRWLQENRDRASVEIWLGISADEIGRVKPSDVQYITNRWPLLEFDPAKRRRDIETFLTGAGLELPPRSACTFCPFQSRTNWRSLSPADRVEAIAVDESIRDKRPPFALYLHASRIPLAQVDLRTEQEKGQLDLFDAECTGHCGL